MQAFLAGIAGNIISAVVIGLIPIIIVVTRINHQQREIAAFFGLSSEVHTIHILLSRYKPKVDVEELADGVQSRGYVGETVTVDEFHGAQAIRELFGSNWIIASFRSIIEKSILGRRDFGKVDVEIDPVSTIPRAGTIILLGTGVKDSNQYAAELLGTDKAHSVYRFVKNEQGRTFERLAVQGFTHDSWPTAKWAPNELAVLQRVTMEDGRVRFLCAGKDELGSMLAARFLARSWQSIHESSRDRNNGDFARLYVFDRDSGEPEILSSVP